MSTQKTNKELAFIHELFVAPDWGERFAELIDEHVQLPKKGEALYVGSNTGGHAIALQERSGEKLRFRCLDENEESTELAREKARTATPKVSDFRAGRTDQLPFADDEFALVIGDGSLVQGKRIPTMLREMTRVAAPGATVALALTTFSSFGEFFSIYWEALHNCGLMDHEAEVESLISVLPSVSAVEEMAEQAGLDHLSSTTKIEEFDFESSEKFLTAPLVSDFLMPIWLENLPAESARDVIEEISRLINEESHGAEFALTVKATLVVGKKALSH
ncbi:MAG TPA: class I SAM-dependent methyltransferase [Pyrinomonadaceae bacterium]|nr:class I SAM-dependent methyltransferase [Pyrinomonadaceae bacterium]